jgi:hypothetical protein
MSVTISPTNSRLGFATRPQVFANGVDVVAIKVRVRDADNAPVASRVVQLFPDNTHTIIQQPAPTDATGVAIGYAKSSTQGPVTFRARVFPDVPEADVPLDHDSPGAVWIEETATANFYSRDIEPAPRLTTTARNVHLTWHVSRYYMNDIDGIRLRIEADDSNLMPTKIFAYQMLPVKPGEFEPVGAFDHVCSSVDLEEYPEDAPAPNSRPAWFRLDYVDVLLRSREEVREFINSVLEDVQILKNTLDITEELVPVGDVWIGTPPETP